MIEVYTYFKKLYENFQGCFVEIRFIHQDRQNVRIPEPPVQHKRIKGNRFLFKVEDFLNAENFKKIYRWAIEVNEARYHVYYGILPRNEEGDPCDAFDILFQDLDFREEGIDIRKKLLLLNKIYEETGIEIGGTESHFTVIGSGRGIQIVAKAKKKSGGEITEEEWLQKQEHLYNLLRCYGIPVDSVVIKDKARVFRFPDTRNWKYEDAPTSSIIVLQERTLFIEDIPDAECDEEEEEVKQKKKNGKKKYIKLSEKQKSEIVNLILPYWKKGHRNRIETFLLGFLVKAGVDRDSSYDIIKRIVKATNDEEEEHRLYLVDYHYKQDPETLSGTEGLRQELRKMGLEENQINLFLFKLQDIINRYELLNLFIKTKYSHPVQGVCNTLQGIFTWKIVKDKNTEEEYMTLDRMVFAGCITRLRIIRNPYVGINEYEIEFFSRSRKFFKFKGNIYEILSRMKMSSLCVWEAKAFDTLNTIIARAEEKGVAKVVEDIEVEGIYKSIKNGQLKLKVDRANIKECSPEEVKEALIVLDTLVSKYFSRTKERVSDIIKWIITAPFNFARKQEGLESWKWLFLGGFAQTGKSTLGGLVGHIWGLPSDFEISAGSLSTQARVGRILSRWTFPFVVNEVKELFSSRYEEVRELLKNAWDRLAVRGKYKAGEWIEELALAPLFMTANRVVEMTGAERRRFFVVNFTAREKPTKEQKEEFNRWKKNLTKLNAIAYEIYRIFKANPELLKKEDFRDAGEFVLKELYRKFVGSVPEWVEMRIDEEEENFETVVIEELKERIIKEIEEYVVEKTLRYKKELKEINDEENATIIRLKELQKLRIPLEVYYDSKTDSLVIRKEFLFYLADKGIEISSLKDLADLFDGEYEKKSFRNLGILGNKVAIIKADILRSEEEKERIQEKSIKSCLSLIKNQKGWYEIDGQEYTEEQIVEKLKEDKEFRGAFVGTLGYNAIRLYPNIDAKKVVEMEAYETFSDVARYCANLLNLISEAMDKIKEEESENEDEEIPF